MSELFTVPEGSIVPSSSPQTLEGWDSIGHLNLVLALEEEFRVTFSPEQIDGMTDAGKVVEVVAQAAS